LFEFRRDLPLACRFAKITRLGHEQIRYLLEDTFPSPKASTAPKQDSPHLRIHCLSVFVRDIEQSLKFYIEQLGFRVLSDSTDDMGRWVTIAPPDGTAILALIAPRQDAEEYALVGKGRFVVFVSDDVPAKFSEWQSRGVRFSHPPHAEAWGGIVTGFEDIDGNRFSLVGFDSASREITAHRRAAQELEAARQVQSKLFPQVQPTLATLDYAGMCVQARHVGGDYYDFLDLGRRRLGLVVADICGKGMAAALLMSNLQAHVRNLCTIYSMRPYVPFVLEQPQRFLQTVNELFFETTTPEAYATLFFVEYDDESRRLRYANCGHIAALILRQDNTLERLTSICGVIGLFKDWVCSAQECVLASGDTLLLCSDGVTESFNHVGEDFGEQRLTEALQKYRDLPPQAIIRSIVDDVQRFSDEEQHDDMTLIVAKCR
jgi:catechol 2,3-dioxygenase-like lactoylglutathione lyase family enzyme